MYTGKWEEYIRKTNSNVTVLYSISTLKTHFLKIRTYYYHCPADYSYFNFIKYVKISYQAFEVQIKVEMFCILFLKQYLTVK